MIDLVTTSAADLISRTEGFGWVWLSGLHLEDEYGAKVSSYITQKEMNRLQAYPPRHCRHRAMGRIAAKDAVRHRLSLLGKECPAPSEITIASGKTGCPRAMLPNGEEFHISIAHSAGIAVAMSSDAAVGIDVERVREHRPGMEELVLSSREKDLLVEVTGCGGPIEAGARCKTFLRFWTAKEAVSKAIGTGLRGRMFDFEIVDGYRELLDVCHHPSQTRYGVSTFTLLHPAHSGSESAEYVVAWTGCDGSKTAS